MKTFLIILGVLTVIGVVIYFILKNAKIVKTQINSINNSGTSILDKIKANDNNPNTGTKPNEMGTGLTEPLGLTYEGQIIYAKLNGVGVLYSEIGYLADKSILKVTDVEYRDGEYKKKVIEDVYNKNGVNIKEIYGIVPISNTFGTFDVTVFKYHKTMKIADFEKGVGFNIEGFVVHKDVASLGIYGSYEYYYY